MSTSMTTAIAENRTIFDGRPISEEDLEVTESGAYALYVAEREAIGTDEVHVFSTSNERRDHSRVHEAVERLTGDPDQPVSEVQFQRGTDGRLILRVAENQTPESYSPSREIANYLISVI